VHGGTAFDASIEETLHNLLLPWVAHVHVRAVLANVARGWVEDGDPCKAVATKQDVTRHLSLRRGNDSGQAADGSIGADNFFVVSPRLTAHANATHAAKLTALHIAHHRQLGFSGHSVFLNRCRLLSILTC